MYSRDYLAAHYMVNGLPRLWGDSNQCCGTEGNRSLLAGQLCYLGTEQGTLDERVYQHPPS